MITTNGRRRCIAVSRSSDEGLERTSVVLHVPTEGRIFDGRGFSVQPVFSRDAADHDVVADEYGVAANGQGRKEGP